jgi:indolepyruvate decarboxylase
VRVGAALYPNVEMKDVLTALARKLTKKQVQAPKRHGLGQPVGQSNEKISVQYFYPRWEQMLKPGDILVSETGTSSMGVAFA